MFYQYKVGKRVMSPGPDGVVFDLTDGGGVTTPAWIESRRRILPKRL